MKNNKKYYLGFVVNKLRNYLPKLYGTLVKNIFIKIAFNSLESYYLDFKKIKVVKNPKKKKVKELTPEIVKE